MENQKIPLYKIRSYGEKISDTFGFLSENFKPLLKFFTYFLLPVSLVMGLAMNGYANGLSLMTKQMAKISEATTSEVMGFVASVGGIVITSLIAYTLLYALVYGLMRVYGDRENGLKNLAWEELKPTFLQMLKRSFKLVLFWVVVGFPIIAILALGLVLVLKPIGSLAIFLIYLVFIVVLMAPIYLFEDDATLISSLTKSFRLGFKTWAGVLGVTLVLSLIVGIIAGIASLPWSIALIMKSMFAATGGGDGFSETFGFSFIFYLLSVLQAFVSYLCYSVPIIGLAYQYGHAVEKIDQTNVVS